MLRVVAKANISRAYNKIVKITSEFDFERVSSGKDQSLLERIVDKVKTVYPARVLNRISAIPPQNKLAVSAAERVQRPDYYTTDAVKSNEGVDIIIGTLMQSAGGVAAVSTPSRMINPGGIARLAQRYGVYQVSGDFDSYNDYTQDALHILEYGTRTRSKETDPRFVKSGPYPVGVKIPSDIRQWYGVKGPRLKVSTIERLLAGDVIFSGDAGDEGDTESEMDQMGLPSDLSQAVTDMDAFLRTAEAWIRHPGNYARNIFLTHSNAVYDDDLHAVARTIVSVIRAKLRILRSK